MFYTYTCLHVMFYISTWSRDIVGSTHWKHGVTGNNLTRSCTRCDERRAAHTNARNLHIRSRAHTHSHQHTHTLTHTHTYTLAQTYAYTHIIVLRDGDSFPHVLPMASHCILYSCSWTLYHVQHTLYSVHCTVDIAAWRLGIIVVLPLDNKIERCLAVSPPLI